MNDLSKFQKVVWYVMCVPVIWVERNLEVVILWIVWIGMNLVLREGFLLLWRYTPPYWDALMGMASFMVPTIFSICCVPAIFLFTKAGLKKKIV